MEAVCVCVKENRESVCLRSPDELVLSIQTRKQINAEGHSEIVGTVSVSQNQEMPFQTAVLGD